MYIFFKTHCWFTATRALKWLPRVHVLLYSETNKKYFSNNRGIIFSSWWRLWEYGLMNARQPEIRQPVLKLYGESKKHRGSRGEYYTGKDRSF